MFMIYVMFFFHAVGITLKFKKIPLKTRIWAHTIGLNPRERPWTLKSVNLERSNLQVDSMCCFRGHQIIYIYLHSFWWGGIEQCKCMVIFRRMSLIIVHCLDRTKKMTFVAGINSMHPRHAVDTCPLKGLQFASSPDG